MKFDLFKDISEMTGKSAFLCVRKVKVYEWIRVSISKVSFQKNKEFL